MTNRMFTNLIVVNILQTCVVFCQTNLKSSLTFVIDDTISMGRDIRIVLDSVDKIFDTVVNSDSSQIENFIIVTFNDPGQKLRVNTRDRDKFKEALRSIKVKGGLDCPELAMSGIELGIRSSLPGSYIFVITDAAAKDHDKFEKVKNLALDMEVQIIFLLTSMCPDTSKSSPGYQVYEKLVEATSGQIFQMKKKGEDLQKILDYVSTLVESRRTELEKKNFPPGYGHIFTSTVDSSIKDISVAVAGDSPRVEITRPNGTKVKTENIVNIPKVKVVGVKNPEPGAHNIEVGSLSDTSVTVLGSTNVNFQYGFSTYKPYSRNETTNRPVPDRKSYVSITLITEDKYINLSKLQLLDLKGNVILEEPLVIANIEDQFYITEPIIPPNDIFKIAIIAVNDKTKETIRRVSATPVEPQRILLETTENIPPTVNIVGKSKISTIYDDPLQLKCSVSGYPTPKIIWEDKLGLPLTFTVSPVKLPYKYLSELDIDHNTANNTYVCKADNDFGSDSKSVEVEAKPHYEVVHISKDKSVEYNKEESLYCKVNANPPANITWYLKGEEIKTNDDISISPDRSTLHIKHMKTQYAGNFICEIRNQIQRNVYKIHLSVTGVEVPKIDKTITKITVNKAANADISCRILKGKPTPTIHWFFKGVSMHNFIKIEAFTENLHIENVNHAKTGTYKCIAQNEIDKDTHVIDLLVEYAPIINGIRNIEITEEAGEVIKIDCPVDGSPMPDVTWSFNKTIINDGNGYHISHENTLKFKVSFEKEGEYVCEAINKLGSAKKTALLRIFESVTVDVPTETNLTVKVGSNLVLACPVKGYPIPTIKWTFISSETKRPKQFSVSGSLELSRVQLNDDGDYICEAKNFGDSVALTYTVSIQAPPQIFTNTTLKNIHCVVGDRAVSIPCSATGKPAPEKTWMKDGTLLNIGSKWFSVDTDGTLYVKNVITSSAGIYVCKATNPLNIVYESFRLKVYEAPRKVGLTTKILLEEGKPAEVECNVPHELTDQVWWFKDLIKLAEGKLIFHNVRSIKNRGAYKCRVSNFYRSTTGKIIIDVGYRPKFTYSDNTYEKYFFDDENTQLMCAFSAYPKATISWWFNKKQLSGNRMTYSYENSVNSIGEYKCAIENIFGKIEKKFNVTSRDCLLNIQKDFDRYHPLVLNNFLFTGLITKFGYLAIPINKNVQFYCPGGFNKFPGTNVKATCVESERFKINEQFEDFTNIKCVDGLQTITIETGETCGYNNTEIIKIGIEVKEFLEFYKICLYKVQNIPLYTQHNLNPYAAGIKSNPIRTWWHSDFINYNADEMYDCEQQKKDVSNIFDRPILIEDHCCFAARQLVNEKDVAPGLPQLSTHSFLNVIPHWNSCNMKNWNYLEDLLREQVKIIRRAISITTGVSYDRPSKASVYIKDKAGEKRLVPNFLWKVIKDFYHDAAVAIIQINVPNLHEEDVKKYELCPSICSVIKWMNGIDWSNVKNGYIYCCNILEFESAFGYKAQFSKGNGRILNYLYE